MILAGCSATNVAPLATIPARQIETQKITLGAAQMLKIGMGGDEVIAKLSSPNIITTDSDGLELWVYDKSSSDSEMVQTSDGWLFQARTQSSVSSVSRRTLIVTIKFDKDRRISKVNYRQTSY